MEAALTALRDANPTSSLPEDWKGPWQQWRGLKLVDDGEGTDLKELYAPRMIISKS